MPPPKKNTTKLTDLPVELVSRIVALATFEQGKTGIWIDPTGVTSVPAPPHRYSLRSLLGQNQARRPTPMYRWRHRCRGFAALLLVSTFFRDIFYEKVLEPRAKWIWVFENKETGEAWVEKVWWERDEAGAMHSVAKREKVC